MTDAKNEGAGGASLSDAGLDAADYPYCGGNDETPPDHCMDCITRPDRQEHHYPVEWGPSDDPHFTCSCGHPDPAHHKAPNDADKGRA